MSSELLWHTRTRFSCPVDRNQNREARWGSVTVPPNTLLFHFVLLGVCTGRGPRDCERSTTEAFCYAGEFELADTNIAPDQSWWQLVMKPTPSTSPLTNGSISTLNLHCQAPLVTFTNGGPHVRGQPNKHCFEGPQRFSSQPSMISRKASQS